MKLFYCKNIIYAIFLDVSKLLKGISKALQIQFLTASLMERDIPNLKIREHYWKACTLDLQLISIYFLSVPKAARDLSNGIY